MALKQVSVCPTCGAPIYIKETLFKPNEPPQPEYSCECRNGTLRKKDGTYVPPVVSEE